MMDPQMQWVYRRSKKASRRITVGVLNANNTFTFTYFFLDQLNFSICKYSNRSARGWPAPADKRARTRQPKLGLL